MIVIYREATGQVVDNSGTNSLFPSGLPEEFIWLNTPQHPGLTYLRLHDEDDIELVNAVLAGHARVEGGAVVIDLTAVPPEPDPPAVPVPTVEDLLSKIVSMQEWAAQMQAHADAMQAQVDAATEILMGGLQ